MDFWRLQILPRPAYVAVPTAMAPYPEFSEAGIDDVGWLLGP